jgi:hypothetical protein
MQIDNNITAKDLLPGLERFWQVSGQKINDLNSNYDPAQGSPVFTVEGKYTTRGWTEWTQGFQYGSEILQFAPRTGGRSSARSFDHGRKRQEHQSA